MLIACSQEQRNLLQEIPQADRNKVPQRILQGEAISAEQLVIRVEPIYPTAAKNRKIEGNVRMLVILATDGSVKSVEVLSGNSLLTESARNAVLQWKFRPTLFNGKPVEVQTFVDVLFRLAREKLERPPILAK
jgi:periplasmic protein TonB